MKPTQLTEGRMSKGGQNPPEEMGKRPPAPKGSGGSDLRSFYTLDHIEALHERKPEEVDPKADAVAVIECIDRIISVPWSTEFVFAYDAGEKKWMARALDKFGYWDTASSETLLGAVAYLETKVFPRQRGTDE